MNTHEHVSIEILADYAEGLLGDADATSVAEHLASCTDCQAEAELLASVSTILASDDPGPMPDHYAARIDAALAELAAAEPVTPKTRDAAAVNKGAGQGAAVIDLASRRRFAPAARVTSVAASLVLLIGGVALGMQALDAGNSGNPSDSVAGDVPDPAFTNLPAIERAALYAQVQEPTGEARKKGKNGAIIDKTTGAVFIKNKVLFPDGTVVVHRKGGVAEVRTFNPETNQVQVAQVRSPRTAPAPTPESPQLSPPVTPERTPERTPEPTPTASPKPTPTPAPAPAPEPSADPSPTSNPWVENSGDTYTPDNFATKVQALLRNSGDTVGASGGSSGANGTVEQNRATTGAVRSQEAAVSARGPAPADVAAKVRRCANQLGLTDLLAGDAGIWRGQSATILVTRLGSAQATGYVVYGDCTKEDPATPASVQWEQRVDLPGRGEPAADPTAGPGTSTPANGSVSPVTSSSAGTSVAASEEQ